MTGGRIPEEAIEAVLKHHDIVGTVGRYVHLSKSGKYMKGLCPFHSEKTPSFTVTPEKGIFHCYGCGKGGNAIHFTMEIEGYSFPEAVRLMAEDAGVPVTWGLSHPSGEHTAEQRDRKILHEAHDYAARYYHYLLLNTEFGRAAKAYLRDRGMTDKLIDQFMIGYAPDRWDALTKFLEKRDYSLSLMEQGGLLSAKNDGSGYVDRFRDRIMFPIWDRDGKVIAFAGRVLGDGQPKYLNSSDSMLFHKSRSLYNFHQARPSIRKSRKVVLFEGYMDVIKAWQAGVHNGVATMGTAFTEEHAEIMRRNADEVIICYDGDDAGQAAALKTIPMLEKTGLRVWVALLPGRKDPDEYIAEYGPQSFLREIMDQPVSVTKFRLIFLRKSHKLLEEEGRKNYVLEGVRIVAELDSPTEREFYLKELSREFGLTLDVLKQECFQIRETMRKVHPQRDKDEQSWNNGMNEGRRTSNRPPVVPAHHQVERRLLYWMMQDAEAAELVHDRLGDAFNVEDHAALAAYLYAYYAQGADPEVSRFISSLRDERLERTATSILSMDAVPPYEGSVLEAHVADVLKQPKLRKLEERKEEWVRAERSGDVIRAAQIAFEITTLERQLRS
ncbi:DNA primase [Paenibacillus darwinianus]|uniref:DNA primase n=1 Tax=Paenibacillus darwinianus TaxID=1380763 RepID=A0A9W5W8U2_9BACL|nr:DNA primase [Paenibacillus darwinianus]EXX91870.1 DNA primase [Paenibacillus darwinianus]EXX92355.1 DNA primase [Paenibacillus darwinianus]EXX92713.1 DNA primase [Paenibacillus darwinianus]